MSQLHRLSLTVMSTVPSKSYTDVRVEDVASLLEILLDQGNGMTTLEITRVPVTVCWCGDKATHINTASDVVEEHPTCTAHLRDGYRALDHRPKEAIRCKGCGEHNLDHREHPDNRGYCIDCTEQALPAPSTLPSYASSPGTTYLSLLDTEPLTPQEQQEDYTIGTSTEDVLDTLVEALTYRTPATSTGSTGWSAASTPEV